MLEYEVHPWLLVLTAVSVTGVVAGILQHRALAIVYVLGTVVALLDIFVRQPPTARPDGARQRRTSS